ncbi:pentapeptide repeat-containing protein [Paenibacillus mesophilus]|uniref:pentapeptide repeat-containing protein n=1 Tax=Paenibacillus mesophilus TaxID=2582849 RepID=UPI00110EF793|nr:pentapeptide repeat-containing protein [Paenibacillus mesophilus]TMV50013.1 pentapeptide repeat-containing protein [Paenibacillus mesophilus]
MEQLVQVTEIIDKREPKQKLVVKNSDISNSEFNDCRAEKVVFHDISLPHVRVTYADLKHCYFHDMNMVNGSISNANLSHLSIDGVNISGMSFRNAGAREKPIVMENLYIPGSKIMNCNLANVELTECNIEGLTINGIRIDELIKSVQEKQ